MTYAEMINEPLFKIDPLMTIAGMLSDVQFVLGEFEDANMAIKDANFAANFIASDEMEESGIMRLGLVVAVCAEILNAINLMKGGFDYFKEACIALDQAKSYLFEEIKKQKLVAGSFPISSLN